MIRNLAQWLPPKARAVVYSVLATLYGIELVVDVVPTGAQDKAIGVLVVLGFGMAALNTPTGPTPAV